MRRPQLPGFEIVGRPGRAVLEFRSQVVEQVRVHTDSGGDGEVARGGLAVEIFVLNSAERDTPDFAADRDLSGGTGAERNSQIVGKSVGSAKRKNGERHGRAR